MCRENLTMCSFKYAKREGKKKRLKNPDLVTGPNLGMKNQISVLAAISHYCSKLSELYSHILLNNRIQLVVL